MLELQISRCRKDAAILAEDVYMPIAKYEPRIYGRGGHSDRIGDEAAARADGELPADALDMLRNVERLEREADALRDRVAIAEAMLEALPERLRFVAERRYIAGSTVAALCLEYEAMYRIPMSPSTAKRALKQIDTELTALFSA